MKNILLVVDVQNDFCPGGNLAVNDGDSIISSINLLINDTHFDHVIATQDWHPQGHISFSSTHHCKPFDKVNVSYGEQILWPDHCIQGTIGAELRSSLDTKNVQFILRKGFRKEIDSYSAFFENDKKTLTGLNGLIKDLAGADQFKLVIVGIATDVCVFNSAMDARNILGYSNVIVVKDACAGVTSQGTIDALQKMGSYGIVCEYLHQLKTEL